MLERTKRLPPAPQAERHPTTSTRHGITLVDDYAWLRADNWREVMRDPGLLDPKIRGYLEAENDYTATALAHTEPLQEALFAEMKGRIKEDNSTVPSPDGPFAYYTRYREGGQHPILCRQLRDGGAEQALLDGDALAAGKAYFQLGGSAHSPDHKLLAWSADDKGSEIDTLRMRDLSTGHDLPDEIPDAEGSIVWSADSTVLYYVRLDTNHRPSRVYRHRLGTPAADDALVYEEQDSRFFVSLGELQSRRFAAISVHDHETSESWLLDLGEPRCQAAACRAARNLGAVRRRASPELGRRREACDPHQCRQGRGLQGHAGSARRSGARELARSHPAPARHLRAQHHRALGLADPARARGLTSAHRGAPHRER